MLETTLRQLSSRAQYTYCPVTKRTSKLASFLVSQFHIRCFHIVQATCFPSLSLSFSACLSFCVFFPLPLCPCVPVFLCSCVSSLSSPLRSSSPRASWSLGYTMHPSDDHVYASLSFSFPRVLRHSLRDRISLFTWTPLFLLP